MSLTVANVDEDREIQACHRQQINTGLGKLWENQPYPYEVHSVRIKVRTLVAPVASPARVEPSRWGIAVRSMPHSGPLIALGRR